MRFTVDSWDPSYGASVDVQVDQSTATIVADVEAPANSWRPVATKPSDEPSAVLFVDGVRRIEARAWIADLDTALPIAFPALCASYAAGVICSSGRRAHLADAQIRRSVVSLAPHTKDIATRAGPFTSIVVVDNPMVDPLQAMTNALQNRLHELEVMVSLTARQHLPGQGIGDESNLLVFDGPIGRRDHLERAIGMIKTHQRSYLPPELHAIVGTLGAGERTPVFRYGTTFQKYSWYLRLPCPPGQPWAGIVRVECASSLTAADAIALADQSAPTLCRYASVEFKDARAPQNLYPIGGLERDLRHRLGDGKLIFRALRQAAA
jgi:hypothetical protein